MSELEVDKWGLAIGKARREKGGIIPYPLYTFTVPRYSLQPIGFLS